MPSYPVPARDGCLVLLGRMLDLVPDDALRGRFGRTVAGWLLWLRSQHTDPELRTQLLALADGCTRWRIDWPDVIAGDRPAYAQHTAVRI